MIRRSWLKIVAAMFASTVVRTSKAAEKSVELVLVVMDPLALPLSCPCVLGYAQRKYEHLGVFLTQQLGRPVKVFWNESLVKAMKEKTDGRADIVIGKYSVVLSDAKRTSQTMTPVASLTGKDGKTTQTGLILVRTDDKAKTVDDLTGYRIFFGTADCDEKLAAPARLLKEHGVTIPDQPETYPACSDSAAALLELPKDAKAAAVISSYAAPLLEGCGTIQKGDLRVVAESEPVPFVTAFVSGRLADDERSAISKALSDAGAKPELLIALETKAGFVAWKEPETNVAAKKKT
jgi:ABC-type phosphate/phosphonate transport system substrate-binding protein